MLTAKQAARKLEDVTAAAKKQAAAANTRISEAVTAALAAQKQQADKQVHLMLCIVKDPTPVAPAKPQVGGLGVSAQVFGVQNKCCNIVVIMLLLAMP